MPLEAPEVLRQKGRTSGVQPSSVLSLSLPYLNLLGHSILVLSRILFSCVSLLPSVSSYRNPDSYITRLVVQF